MDLHELEQCQLSNDEAHDQLPNLPSAGAESLAPAGMWCLAAAARVMRCMLLLFNVQRWCM